MDSRDIDAYLEWRGIHPRDACVLCGGAGVRVYPNTATWRRVGMSGQMLTTDVCDLCWGSGSTSHHWPSWREREAQPKPRQV